jgi:hypothetical protein
MNPKVLLLAQAIAQAEGFNAPGSLPQRCNNPGDLEMGDVGCGVDQGKTIFPNEQAGWTALENQVDLMLTGKSHVYKPNMTLLTVADLYTGGDMAPAWAQIVAHKLGISVVNTLSEYYNS